MPCCVDINEKFVSFWTEKDKAWIGEREVGRQGEEMGGKEGGELWSEYKINE